MGKTFYINFFFALLAYCKTDNIYVSDMQLFILFFE